MKNNYQRRLEDRRLRRVNRILDYIFHEVESMTEAELDETRIYREHLVLIFGVWIKELSGNEQVWKALGWSELPYDRLDRNPNI